MQDNKAGSLKLGEFRRNVRGEVREVKGAQFVNILVTLDFIQNGMKAIGGF